MKKIPDKVFDEVKETYLKQIDIPKIKPEIQYILCPIGLVGAGKTTVLKPLSKKLNLVYVSADDIRKLFKERGFGYDRAKELALKVAEKFIIEGFSVATDSDLISKESQKKVEEIIRKFNLRKIWIHVNPLEEFIINKLKNFKHTWLFKDANRAIENYKARKPLHENLNFDFSYIFDTSKNNLSEQIDEAIDIINNDLNSQISSNTDQ